jgi:hypothetical protein
MKTSTRPLAIYDLTNADWEAIQDREPDVTITTGLSSGEGATELQIYHRGKRTIVVPAGEAHNAEPWAHRSGHTAERILADYLNEFKDSDDQGW